MRILISGASGLVGRELLAHLKSLGHGVQVLVRREAKANNELSWDPGKGVLDPQAVEYADAVINLSGHNIAEGRWTASEKQLILDSRLQTTRLLAETIAASANPPAVLLSASAIGYYGDAGEAVCDEDAPAEHDFLADVCARWEAATEVAADNCRVCNLRIGVVLSTEGGALKKSLLPFKLGLGGRLGHGQQFMSWIHNHDLARACAFLLEHDDCSGPVNLVSPNPVRNAEYTRALGRALHRPALFPAPAFVLRLALGEMAEALLLSSTRVFPAKLLDAGFKFNHEEIDEAFGDLLR